MPSSGYCREHGDDCPDLVIRADHPVTPEMVEILEISETEGADAAARRGNQLARNRKLREMRSSSKRYAAIALEKNMRIAAEKLAQQKLAADKLAQQKLAAEKAATIGGPQLPSVGNCGDASAAQNPEVGCLIPPSVGGVGLFPDINKKPPVSVANDNSAEKKEDAIA